MKVHTVEFRNFIKNMKNTKDLRQLTFIENTQKKQAILHKECKAEEDECVLCIVTITKWNTRTRRENIEYIHED